jgi:tetratricopeptide (TPR) repeat protein
MRGVFFAATILVVAFASSTYAQNVSVDDLNKLRIAQALEQAGEFDKALEFYQQLYQSSPDNFVYFDGLRRTYMNLKKYADAKSLLNAKLRSEPANVLMMCQLADVYFKSGQEDSAKFEWDKTLTIDPKNPNTYRAVAGSMADDRLFDDAISVYRKGESSTGVMFTNEISRLYFLNANFAGSLHELLKGLQAKQAPYILSNIEAQIGAYSSSKEAVGQFTSEMEKEVAVNPDNVDYRRLLGFLYVQEKNYPAAYTTYKWLDNHSGSPGSELLQFAMTAYNDEAYDVAASAFKEVASLSKNNSFVVQALVGNASSLQKIGEQNLADDDRPCTTSDSLKELNQALSGYEKILEQFPSSPYLNTVVFNSVELKMEYFHDLPGAEKMLTEYSGKLNPSGNDWALLRIRLYMKEGKFQDAFSTAYGIITSNQAVSHDQHDEIEYRAAVALYYLGLYDSSAYYLRSVTSNPMSDAANEAIQLLNTITDNRGNPPALRQFASASAMEESGRIPEATAMLERLLSEYPGIPLGETARFSLAGDYCMMGNVAAALKNYSVLAEDSTGVFADRADFRICRIYENTLHQNEKAVAGYEHFLIRFPNSIYQNKVRDILRSLLGENS